jgi:prepilin signal peptidase PulO-like enzyme (type II secretory pathway)
MNIFLAFQIANTALWGLLGLVIGSFLNVCIYRIPEKRTVVKGHSMCMSCGHNLGTLDLFPLFSWLFLRGKCRYCGAPIASRYAKIEGLTGLVFALLAWTRRDAFFLSLPSIKELAQWGTLLILVALASVIIVSMMILKDHGTGMILFPVICLTLLATQVLFAFVQALDMKELAKSVALSGLAAILVVGVLIILVPLRKKPTRSFWSDLLSGKTFNDYFSLENRNIRITDCLFVVLSAAIGWPAAIPCLVAYPLFRFAGTGEKMLRYYGIVLSVAAWAGLILLPNRVF